MENLKTCVEMAAKKMVMLSIETVDNPFLNSLSKVDYLKTQIHSPFLQAYPDVGNLTAWPETMWRTKSNRTLMTSWPCI